MAFELWRTSMGYFDCSNQCPILPIIYNAVLCPFIFILIWSLFHNGSKTSSQIYIGLLGWLKFQDLWQKASKWKCDHLYRYRFHPYLLAMLTQLISLVCTQFLFFLSLRSTIFFWPFEGVGSLMPCILTLGNSSASAMEFCIILI